MLFRSLGVLKFRCGRFCCRFVSRNNYNSLCPAYQNPIWLCTSTTYADGDKKKKEYKDLRSFFWFFIAITSGGLGFVGIWV